MLCINQHAKDWIAYGEIGICETDDPLVCMDSLVEEVVYATDLRGAAEDRSLQTIT